MLYLRAANNFKRHKLERNYAALGAALGLAFSFSGFLIDMQVRVWRGLDAGLASTFSASLMHLLALSSPLIMARIFMEIGRRQHLLQERLRQMAQLEEHMRKQAHGDAVTGLFNRSYLTVAMEEGIATKEWQRMGALLFMLDLDEFKQVNDTLGHRAGDVVLAEVGRRLRLACGPMDIPVRLGGDEFLVVHFPAERSDGPKEFAERLIRDVCGEIVYEDVRITPSVSIGVARVGVDGSTWSDVMRSADVALYRAKAEASSAYRVFAPEMTLQKKAQTELLEQMRQGIERNEFELHYQPIYGAKSGQIRSFEALVRWNHPTRGMIAPMDFIPLAESSGLIVPLGRRILLDACLTAATWPKPVGIAVNLSSVQLKDPALVSTVKEALAESGLAPGRLDLELTESVLLEPSPRVLAAVDELRALGVRITMDDFGTGFSSLNNLRRLRFDRLKIDRSFTENLSRDQSDAEIVRTIVRLSAALRMETILEGVETDSQVAFAQSEGLTEVQGFLYSRPLTAAAAAELLAQREKSPGTSSVPSAA